MRNVWAQIETFWLLRKSEFRKHLLKPTVVSTDYFPSGKAADDRKFTISPFTVIFVWEKQLKLQWDIICAIFQLKISKNLNFQGQNSNCLDCNYKWRNSKQINHIHSQVASICTHLLRNMSAGAKRVVFFRKCVDLFLWHFVLLAYRTEVKFDEALSIFKRLLWLPLHQRQSRHYNCHSQLFTASVCVFACEKESQGY